MPPGNRGAPKCLLRAGLGCVKAARFAIQTWNKKAQRAVSTNEARRASNLPLPRSLPLQPDLSFVDLHEQLQRSLGQTVAQTLTRSTVVMLPLSVSSQSVLGCLHRTQAETWSSMTDLCLFAWTIRTKCGRTLDVD